MYHYYFYVETVMELELNIAKVGLTAKQVLELDQGVGRGVPYFHSGQENYGVGEDSAISGAMANVIGILNSGKAVSDITVTETGKRIVESQ